MLFPHRKTWGIGKKTILKIIGIKIKFLSFLTFFYNFLFTTSSIVRIVLSPTVTVLRLLVSITYISRKSLNSCGISINFPSPSHSILLKEIQDSYIFRNTLFAISKFTDSTIFKWMSLTLQCSNSLNFFILNLVLSRLAKTITKLGMSNCREVSVF
jgi:hypothetical protein